jgi:hypothetical protein
MGRIVEKMVWVLPGPVPFTQVRSRDLSAGNDQSGVWIQIQFVQPFSPLLHRGQFEPIDHVQRGEFEHMHLSPFDGGLSAA